MQLTLSIELKESLYGLYIFVRHQNVDILRCRFTSKFTNASKQDTLRALYDKLCDLKNAHKPLELFSDDSIFIGGSISLSFANSAFIFAQTILPSLSQEATINNIYLLRPAEIIQFQSELAKFSESLLRL